MGKIIFLLIISYQYLYSTFYIIRIFPIIYSISLTYPWIFLVQKRQGQDCGGGETEQSLAAVFRDPPREGKICAPVKRKYVSPSQPTALCPSSSQVSSWLEGRVASHMMTQTLCPFERAFSLYPTLNKGKSWHWKEFLNLLKTLWNYILL